MGLFAVISMLITLAAVFSFLHFRYIHLPTTIGIMLISLVASLALIGLGMFGCDFHQQAALLLNGIDFNRVLLHGLLALLLFAGSLHINLNDLSREWNAVLLL